MSETRVELAKALARFAHEGQTDKAGQPYYLHPFAVAEGVESEDEKITALLHDVIEDTSVRIETIRDLFGTEVADAVLSVTRREDEDYYDFVWRAKENPIGRAVKLADLAHNMDLSRIPEPTEKDYRRLAKYREAREIILKD